MCFAKSFATGSFSPDSCFVSSTDRRAERVITITIGERGCRQFLSRFFDWSGPDCRNDARLECRNRRVFSSTIALSGFVEDDDGGDEMLSQWKK